MPESFLEIPKVEDKIMVKLDPAKEKMESDGY
jgi:hypothetical protein